MATTYRIIRTQASVLGPRQTDMGEYADQVAAELNMGQLQLDDIALIDSNKVSYEIQEINDGKAS